MKKLPLIILIFLIIPITIVHASDKQQIPVVEELDLLVDGTTPQNVSVSEDFSYISRIIWDLHWSGNELDFDNFGDDVALTVGIAKYYDGVSLFSNITDIHGFSHSGFELRIDRDDKNPKNNHLVATNSFAKYIYPYGLPMRNHELDFIISDNITLATRNIDHFQVIVEGFIFDDTTGTPTKTPNFFSEIQNFAMIFLSNPVLWVLLIIPIAFIIKIVKG